MGSIRSTTSSHYDHITSDDLFDQFMNVASEAATDPNYAQVSRPSQPEQSTKNSTVQLSTKDPNLAQPEELTRNATVQLSNDSNLAASKAGNNINQEESKIRIAATVSVTQPTFQSYISDIEPMYETCDNKKNIKEQVDRENSSAVEYAVVVKSKSNDEPEITDKNKTAETISADENRTEMSEAEIAEMYAKPNKATRKNEIAEAFNGKTEAELENGEQKIDTSTYDVVGKTISTVESDYETVAKPLEHVLKAEEVAFSGNNKQQRRATESTKLYNSCLDTIEKKSSTLPNVTVSPTKDNKKHFHFSFHKHKNSEEIKRNKKQRWSVVNEKKSEAKKPGVPVVCDGYLFKQGGSGLTPKNWRLRWFELKSDNCLYYYNNQQDHIPNGAVMLFKYMVSRAPEVNKRFAFKLSKSGARVYFFAANSEEEMKKWMGFFNESAKKAISEQTSIPECSLKNVSIPALSITEPDCHGYIYKQGNMHKSWKKRYCVMKYGCLFYYEEMSDRVAIGVFKLHNYTVSRWGQVRFGFQVTPPLTHVARQRTYFFYTDSDLDTRRWIEAMKHSISQLQTSNNTT